MNIPARQLQFINEYARDGNGAAAACRAGYAPGSAKVTASRLLSKANLRAAVEARQAATAARLDLSRERVIRELVSAIAAMEPIQDRRNGASSGSALWSQCMIGVMAPAEDRRIGASAGSA